MSIDNVCLLNLKNLFIDTLHESYFNKGDYDDKCSEQSKWQRSSRDFTIENCIQIHIESSTKSCVLHNELNVVFDLRWLTCLCN